MTSVETADREVIVLGGGISGLTAAWHLTKAGVDVCLVESERDVGGCTRTERRGGFLLERGPFNVIVRDPSFESLLDDVADEVQVIPASKIASARFVYHDGRLHAVPTNPIALMTTGLLSFGARCRMIRGLFLSGRAGDNEQTIEQAATRRFGSEVSNALVSAAISGIYAGDIGKLSSNACFPSVARVDAEARSLIGYGLRSALRSWRSKEPRRRRRWRGLVSLDGGLGALTSTLGKRLGGNLLCNTQVEAIRAVADGYEVECRSCDSDDRDEARTLRCRRLVVALPLGAARKLLRPLIPDAVAAISPVESSSLVVLNLAYRRADVGHPLEGFGFLVPRNEPRFPLMGVLWADSTFPHHAPADQRLLRVFVGGPRDPDAVNRSDDQLLQIVTRNLGKLLGLSGDPTLVDVCRHRLAIPQYYLGHLERIEKLRAAVAAKPGLSVIGNYLEGVSLNDCVRLATRCAKELIEPRGAVAARH